MGAQRAAWSAYLEAAKACGLLAGQSGTDLIARLTSVDDDQFRSAMAECQAAWYLSSKLGLEVSARPTGKGASELELLVKLTDGDINVEVKSPLRVPEVGVHTLDDSDILDRCLADASKQLRKDTRNLVMIVGRLTLGVHARRFFVKAFYAEERWVFNKVTREASIEFDNPGRFLKVWPGENGPRHTRVGGVLFVQERLHGTELPGGEIGHAATSDALMMHNPCALKALPESIWDCPEVVLRGDELMWTDGYPMGGPKPS
jgi:hypothetical protein